MNALNGAQRLADLLNTEDLRRPDRREPPFASDDTLTTSAALARWLDAHGLGVSSRVTSDDLDLARRLRSDLRAVIERGDGWQAGIERFNVLARELPVALELGNDGQPHPMPMGSGARSSLARLLADLVLGGPEQWQRLKACSAPDCRWAFVDHSRPGTGRWCSSSACGNRDKTRRYRAARRKTRAPG